MSEEPCPKYSGSASDGNLAELKDESFENQIGHQSEELSPEKSEVEKQVFFTLPRWMSGRRRSRRKIKDIKVDVPFKAKEQDVIMPPDHPFPPLKQKKKYENPIAILSKLFKKSSTFNPLPNSSSKELVATHNHSFSSKRKSTRVLPISHTISASNTDIRSHIVSDVPDYHDYFRGKTPAVCGIRNHGNTCFMNAVMQCLSNTDFFAEYFVMEQYKNDFQRRNKIHAKKYGTKGEVTEQLAAVLQCLWSCQYCPEVSYKFKHLVAKYGSQWEGSNQHDAQEFLLWLLDKVHEDLNTAPKQKYRKPKSTHGRADEELAAETLANHLRCNSSFIHDLFQGQLRSSLSCPSCAQHSNTFDPYLCISLPVPHCQTTPVFINLVLLGKDKVVKIGLLVDLQATVKDVKEKIYVDYAISKQKIILAEFSEGEFHRTFCDTDPVDMLKETEVYAFETPLIKPQSSNEEEQMILVAINRVLLKDDKTEFFWKPFVLQVSRESDFGTIQSHILKSMDCVMKDDVDVGTDALFQLRVIDGVPVHEILPHTVELPLYMPVVDQALTLCNSGYSRGPQHLKIAVEWEQETKEKLVEEKPFLEEDQSYLSLKHIDSSALMASLYECFDMYFKEEKLGIEDAWMCPYCHRRLQGVKKLSLWSLPDVFIVHLKRFRQTYCQRTKVTTLVEFPLSGLDMNPYIASRRTDIPQHTTNGNVNQIAMWSPWRRPRPQLFPKCEDNVYDLYAVCNHLGSMQGGHYTACCKNPVDGHWYMYDDEKVQTVQDSEVMTANAYILFYQRSTLSVHSCASSSTSGYSSASSMSLMASEHWAFHMPLFLHIVPKTSKSQDNLSNFFGSSTLDRRMNSEYRPFTRAAKSYSSMIQVGDTKSSLLPVTNNEDAHSDGEVCLEDVIPPPPPPPAKRYWTITSV